MRYQKASRYSEGQARLAGREQVVWAGKGKLAGRKAGGSEAGVMQEGTYLDIPHLMQLHGMSCPTYHTCRPLDAQLGMRFKKFGLFLQGIQGTATQLFFLFPVSFCFA